MSASAKPAKRSGGFTIIEVLIVLAIAGLIMVVVFLAVPSLQRSGRNNALNAAANNVLTAVGNYTGNNNGTMPTDIQFSGNTVEITGGAGSNSESTTVDASVADVMLNGAVIDDGDDVGTIQVITGTTAKCNATASGLQGSTSPRSYAVLFVAESGTGNILKCIGS